MTSPDAQDMRAVEIRADGGHFELAPTRRPKPAPQAGEILIAVKAAGINGHDVHQLHNGGHPLKPGETDLPGLEVAGIVTAVGSGVARWRVGDAVTALLRGGGYAEFAVAPEGNCLPKPANLGWAEAAVLPETHFTVWSNIFIDAGLAPGESFLMNGGTSGIGVAAIQIAASQGHQVFASARGRSKVEICEQLGATRGIDYETEDFAAVVQEKTGGKGVDVILDIVAGDYLEKDIAALAEGGRVVFIGGARGFRSEIDLRQLMRKRLTVGGSLLRPRSDAFKARVATALEERVWPLVCSGKIRPMLDRTFPLAEAAQAIACLEQRSHVGKVALLVSDD